MNWFIKPIIIEHIIVKHFCSCNFIRLRQFFIIIIFLMLTKWLNDFYWNGIVPFYLLLHYLLWVCYLLEQLCVFIALQCIWNKLYLPIKGRQFPTKLDIFSFVFFQFWALFIGSLYMIGVTLCFIVLQYMRNKLCFFIKRRQFQT